MRILVKKETLNRTDDQVRSIFDKEKTFDKEKELKEYYDKEVDSDDPLLSNWNHPSDLLREYISLIADAYDVKPSIDFKSDLKECGFLSTLKPLNASQAATGSPPKG